MLGRSGNQEIFRRLRLVPRVMRNVSDIDMATTMLGHNMSFPVYISGAAKGGLGHPDAEEALCRAAASAGILQMCPHMSTKTFEQMAAARAQGQVQFLQLYVEKDRESSKATVMKANKLGFSGLFLTVRSIAILLMNWASCHSCLR
jgi:L-lactate dehydrogenase (cytochrome)